MCVASPTPEEPCEVIETGRRIEPALVRRFMAQRDEAARPGAGRRTGARLAHIEASLGLRASRDAGVDLVAVLPLPLLLLPW